MENKITYTLWEAGYPHTTGLSLEDANEMLERHRRIFDDIDWWIAPDQNN